MPTYILLSNITDDGAETIVANPARIREVNDEVAGMGVRVTAQYATLGPYDFVTIVEAPDNEAVTRMSVQLAARGTVKLTTLAAMPIDQFIATVRK